MNLMLFILSMLCYNDKLCLGPEAFKLKGI